MECMRAFCNDQQIDINTRLSILENLKKIIKSMTDEDLMLLLVYKTNAILAHSNLTSGTQIDSSSIDSEPKRRELILDWIEQAQSNDDYTSLLNLFRIWPRFTNDPPILVYLTKLASNRPKLLDVLDFTLENHETGLNLTPDDLESLLNRLRDNHQEEWKNPDEVLKRNFLKICLVFRSKDNSEFVLGRLKSDCELECFKLMDSTSFDNHQQLDSNVSYQNLVDDNELADLIQREKFYSELVNTKIYAVFLRNLVNRKQKPELLDVVRELKSNGGLGVEAGELLSTAENFFSSYRNLSVSLALVNKLS